MARASTNIITVCVVTVLFVCLIGLSANACPTPKPASRCETAHFLGPQYVFSGHDLTKIYLGSDGRTGQWSAPACCAVCQTYLDTKNAKTCVAFTVEINHKGAATCILKSKAVADGKKCPHKTTCISGKL